MFVSPGSLGEGGLWWDRLAIAPWKEFQLFFEELRGEQDRILDWARSSGIPIRDMGPLFEPATESELDRAVRGAEGHLLVGPHGWSHENLAALPTEDLDRPLELPLSWLRDRHPDETVPILAYPYGLTSAEVCDRASRTGHRAGLLIDGNWMPRSLDSVFRIPRRNLASGMPLERFGILLAR
jgi:peptidoglycan/xylan/chitin deacetylase (PgdA/CDA1 family)